METKCLSELSSMPDNLPDKFGYYKVMFFTIKIVSIDTIMVIVWTLKQTLFVWKPNFLCFWKRKAFSSWGVVQHAPLSFGVARHSSRFLGNMTEGAFRPFSRSRNLLLSGMEMTMTGIQAMQWAKRDIKTAWTLLYHCLLPRVPGIRGRHQATLTVKRRMQMAYSTAWRKIQYRQWQLLSVYRCRRGTQDVLPYSHQVHGLSSRWFQTS